MAYAKLLFDSRAATVVRCGDCANVSIFSPRLNRYANLVAFCASCSIEICARPRQMSSAAMVRGDDVKP
jgi:hypothetical protein